jgi:hypothetical protein
VSIEVAVDIPETVTGTALLTFVPFPSCPELLFPQHCTSPLDSNAHVWESEAEIAMAGFKPNTVTGVRLSSLLLFPSLEDQFDPQHLTTPLESNAQV